MTLLQQASYFAAHELTHVRQLNGGSETLQFLEPVRTTWISGGGARRSLSPIDERSVPRQAVVYGCRSHDLNVFEKGTSWSV